MSGLNVTKEQFLNSLLLNPKKFNKYIYDQMKINSTLRWGFSHGMYVFGVDSPAEFVLKAKNYYLEEIPEKIQCPTLIIDVENEIFFKGQAKRLYNTLTCNKDYIFFTSEEGAGSHCQKEQN